MKNINGIIPDTILQLGHLSPDERSHAGCGHLADTKTLKSSKQHYHKKSSNFGFAVNLRQTEVKSDAGRKLANPMPNITSLVMRRCLSSL
jgi:hypothetical protein